MHLSITNLYSETANGSLNPVIVYLIVPYYLDNRGNSELYMLKIRLFGRDVFEIDKKSMPFGLFDDS